MGDVSVRRWQRLPPCSIPLLLVVVVVEEVKGVGGGGGWLQMQQLN